MCGICTMKINVVEYFKPGEKMRIMYYSVSDTGILGKNPIIVFAKNKILLTKSQFSYVYFHWNTILLWQTRYS